MDVSGSPSNAHLRRGENLDVIVKASAPTRIDLAGGTIDIWPLYTLHPGCTVNMAINLMARVALQTARGSRVTIASIDQATDVVTSTLELSSMRSLPLVREVALHHWRGCSRGFRLVTSCESPAGAGLGGSSALAIALGAAFARARGVRMSATQAVVVAKNLEARVLGIPTGTQDYWSALRGGLNVIHFGTEGERPEQPGVPADEVARRLVLVYSGKSRSSGINNWQVVKDRLDSRAPVTRALARIAEASRAMADAIATRSWAGFTKSMRREWDARMELADGILTPDLRDAIEIARPIASAWKVCGAGGGGCMVFACEPERAGQLRARLAEAGVRVLEFAPARRGLRVARVGA